MIESIIVVLVAILVWIGVFKVLDPGPGLVPMVWGGSESMVMTADETRDADAIVSEFDGKTFEPISTVEQLKSMKYNNNRIITTNCHAGQRKLMLTEIQFYSCIEENLIVYSGSAAGDHMSVILKMFPNKKFILIDPAFHNIDADYMYLYQNVDVLAADNIKKFKSFTESRDERVRAHAARLLNAPFYGTDKRYNTLAGPRDEIKAHAAEFKKSLYKGIIADIKGSGTYRIFIIQDYLTPELADLLAKAFKGGGEPFSYVSDIRSTMFGDMPSDMDYVWNDALQLYLIKVLRPKYSMLKFHPPYFEDKGSYEKLMGAKDGFHAKMRADIELVGQFGIDMLANYKKGVHEYFKNRVIWLQAWAPNHSSETRLIVSADAIDEGYQNYDHAEWDNKFYYFRYLRMYGYFGMFYEPLAKYTSAKHLHNPYEGCFDCTYEMFILGNYLLRSGAFEMNAADVGKYIFEHPDALLGLHSLIEKNLLYPSSRSVKCGFHDQIVEPLVGLNVFLYDRRLYIREKPAGDGLKLAASVARVSKIAAATMKKLVQKTKNET